MLLSYKKLRIAAFVSVFFGVLSGLPVQAQSSGSSTVEGTVVDPTGAVVRGAVVEIHNPVSGLDQTTTTNSLGKFAIPNIPFNPYHLTITEKGFAPYVQDIEVRSVVPVELQVSLSLSASSETVTVQGGAEDLLENDSTFHTDVDQEPHSTNFPWKASPPR